MLKAMLIASLLAGSVATSATSPALPTWNVHWGDPYCSIIHHPRADPDLTVMFRLIPCGATADILFMRSEWPSDHDQPRRLRFSFAGEQAMTVGTIGTTVIAQPNGPPLIAASLARADVDRLVGGDRLTVMAEHEEDFVVVPVSGGRLMSALSECENSQVTSWGFDPRQPAAKPLNAASFFAVSDYPETALREHRQGSVQFLTAVGPDGRVTECRVLVSSGHDDLDRATCNALQRRARFESFDGPPRIYVGRTNWQSAG